MVNKCYCDTHACKQKVLIRSFVSECFCTLKEFRGMLCVITAHIRILTLCCWLFTCHLQFLTPSASFGCHYFVTVITRNVTVTKKTVVLKFICNIRTRGLYVLLSYQYCCW
jgi:hypothetical protein